MISACSGHVNDGEHPRYLTDGKADTKWCCVQSIPGYVEYDLGKPTTVKAWSITNAGVESPSYITGACYLQGRNSKSEEWQTLDALIGNTRNKVSRQLSKPVDTRFVRLLVVQPEQGADGRDTRIYEFAVY